jgi:hypothetical protein
MHDRLIAGQFELDRNANGLVTAEPDMSRGATWLEDSFRELCGIRRVDGRQCGEEGP